MCVHFARTFEKERVPCVLSCRLVVYVEQKSATRGDRPAGDGLQREGAPTVDCLVRHPLLLHRMGDSKKRRLLCGIPLCTLTLCLWQPTVVRLHVFRFGRCIGGWGGVPSVQKGNAAHHVHCCCPHHNACTTTYTLILPHAPCALPLFCFRHTLFFWLDVLNQSIHYGCPCTGTSKGRS